VTTDKAFYSGYIRRRKEAEPMTDERRAAAKRSAERRARQKMHDIVDSNVWDWFITGTLDSEKVGDRYDYESVSAKVAQRLDNIRRRISGATILMVPERHKDGAWHFHGLLSGFGDSIGTIITEHKDNKGRPVYNWGLWTLGHSTATKVGDSEKAGKYLAKYMTKDNGLPEGKRRYWATHGADKSERSKADIGIEGQKQLHEALAKNAMTASGKTVKAVRSDGIEMQITYQKYTGRKAANQAS
jgi:hypothetical protein